MTDANAKLPEAEHEHVKYLRDLGHLYGTKMNAERCRQLCRIADFIESVEAQNEKLRAWRDEMLTAFAERDWTRAALLSQRSEK